MNLYEAIKKANAEEDDNKQKFIDYCKGKIKKIQPVKIKGTDVSGYAYIDDEKENESYIIRVDYISSDDYKALNPGDTLEYFGLENSYLSPKGNFIDGGAMDAGQLNHLAEMDFKYIDSDLYNELLDNWESWEMPMRFEDTDLNEGETFTIPKEIVDKVRAEYDANKPEIKKELEEELRELIKMLKPYFSADEIKNLKEVKAYKDAIKDPEDIWCECSEETDSKFKPDGEPYLGVDKHAYICNKCGKYTQIG